MMGMGVLFEGILYRSLKGWGTNMKGSGFKELMYTKTHWGMGDSGWDSLSALNFPNCSRKEVGRNDGTLTMV